MFLREALKRQITKITLMIAEDQVPVAVRKLVYDKFKTDCRSELPNVKAVRVEYQRGRTANGGFLEYEGRAGERQPSDAEQELAGRYVFTIFDAAVTKARIDVAAKK